MHILWISHFLLYPKTGFGALQRSRNLLEYLSEKNEVTLVSLVRGDAFGQKAALDAAKRELEDYCRRVVFVPHLPNGLFSRIAALGRGFLPGASYSTELYASNGLRAEILAAEAEADIIHADTMGLIEPLFGQIKKPCVLTHHNIESVMMERRADLATAPLLKAFFRMEAGRLRAFEQKFAPLYRMNITVSEADKRSLLKIAPNALAEVVENPVDTGYFRPGNSSSEQEILFAGNLNWYPNADAVAYFCEQVWPLLAARAPRLRFSLIGGDRDKDPLAARFGSDRIVFHGFVDDVRPYFQRARAFVCPMRDGGGTRLKLVDAFAAGTPVVSTTVGAEGLDADHEAHLLLADSPQVFADSVARVLSDDTLARRLSLSARELVENRYSQSVLGARLESIYELCLRSH